MKIAVFKDTAAKAGKPVMDAFIQSLEGEDYVVCTNDKRPEVDVVVIWSVLLNMYERKPIYDYYKDKLANHSLSKKKKYLSNLHNNYKLFYFS